MVDTLETFMGVSAGLIQQGEKGSAETRWLFPRNPALTPARIGGSMEYTVSFSQREHDRIERAAAACDYKPGEGEEFVARVVKWNVDAVLKWVRNGGQEMTASERRRLNAFDKRARVRGKH